MKQTTDADARNTTAEDIAESFGVDTDDVDTDDINVPDLPDTLDLSTYKTAHGAAKAAAEHLRHYADADDHVTVRREEMRDGHKWVVAWESGSPYEWAVWLTGGESLYHGEFPSGGADPQIVGFHNKQNWCVECERSFVLGFYPQ